MIHKFVIDLFLLLTLKPGAIPANRKIISKFLLKIHYWNQSPGDSPQWLNRSNLMLTAVMKVLKSAAMGRPRRLVFQKTWLLGKIEDFSFWTNLSFLQSESVVVDPLQSVESHFEVVGPLNGSKKWFQKCYDCRYDLRQILGKKFLL